MPTPSDSSTTPGVDVRLAGDSVANHANATGFSVEDNGQLNVTDETGVRVAAYATGCWASAVITRQSDLTSSGDVA